MVKDYKWKTEELLGRGHQKGTGDLIRLMIQEAACDLESKQILWVKFKREFEPLYELLDSLRPDEDHRYWIVPKFSLTLELKIREQ